MTRMKKARCQTGPADGDRTGTEDQQLWHPSPNPLHNHLILKVLMSHVQVPDLLACRLVNSTWKSLATPFLKRKAALGSNRVRDMFIMGYKSWKSSRTWDEELSQLGLFGIDMDKFSLDMRTLTWHVRIIWDFMREFDLHFKYMKITVSIPTLKPLGGMMFKSSSPSLEHLKIILVHGKGCYRDDDPFCSSGGCGYGSIWSGTPANPSIKCIEITMNHCHVKHVAPYTHVDSNYDTFMKCLLQRVPNLQTLKLVNSPRERDPNSAEGSRNIFLQVLKDCSKKYCPKLKEVIFDGYYDEESSNWDKDVLIGLEVNFVQLQPPEIRSIRTAGSPDDLRLLERHRNTLETLVLDIPAIPTHEPSSNVTFPTFPMLTKLTVKVRLRLWSREEIPVIPGIILQPVNYGKQFPALRELLLDFGCKEYEEGHKPSRFDRLMEFYDPFFPADGQVCSTLEVLEIEKFKANVPQTAYHILELKRRLAGMFPNVHNKELDACRLGNFVTRQHSRSLTQSK